MLRKKILVMTDSPKLHTGFARVGKEIFTYLNGTGKYDIKCVGWFSQETKEDITYPVWTTQTDGRGGLLQEDKYAHKSLPGFIDEFKPDLLWTLGDMWMVDHVMSLPSRKEFKWIGYFPIDGDPVPSKWGQVVESMDIAVAYGKYGYDVILKRAPKANLKYIYHGVNTKVFKKKDPNIVREDKNTLLGISDDIQVIGVVSRNQPRKAFDKLFEAYSYLLNGAYLICGDCNKITVLPFDVLRKEHKIIIRCKHCHSKNLSKGKPKENVRLYLHTVAKDCGWDLIDLQHDYDLVGKILINPDMRIGVGVAETTLAALYNTFDIFTLPTRGEGFGLPILEAMACGVPVIVTDYSAPTEWVGGCGELIPPVTLEAEPLTNIRRAIIDMDLYVTSLVKLLEDADLRKKYGDAGLKQAEKMDWGIIVKQWEALIDGVLYPKGIPKDVKISDVEYRLEEI